MKRACYDLEPYRPYSVLEKALKAFRLCFFPEKVILFSPHPPNDGSLMQQFCLVSNYAITQDPTRRHHAAVLYYYTPEDGEDAVIPQHFVDEISPDPSTIINGRLLDFSKATVGRLFEEVFGYNLDVDPLNYEGSIVEKSNANATHDGRVLQGPLKREDLREHRVYQKEIKNYAEGADAVTEYRLPRIHGVYPLVYIKTRPMSRRFGGVNSSVEMHLDLKQVFSEEEIAKLEEFARATKLDCGEIDVLRDRDDGRIYVIDINPTAHGPLRGITPERANKARRILASHFRDLVASKEGQSPVAPRESEA